MWASSKSLSPNFVELVPDADVRGAEAVLQADVDDVVVLLVVETVPQVARR
jgi:hypothetical protein